MASSVWEFIKRHKGKIVAGGVAVGGVYAAKKVYDSELFDQLTSSTSRIIEQENQLSLARKHFIFDAHQQSCDKSLTESIYDIKSILKCRYPVETLVDTVKDPDIMAEEKIRIFEDIKVRAIARVVSTSFAYSLVVIASKTQKSIICAETCKSVEKTRHQQLQNSGVLTYVSSLIFGEDDAKKRAAFTDPKVQQVFLNCIQFLTTTGLNQLFNKIDGIVEELLVDYPLNKMMTVAEFVQLFEMIVERVEQTCGNNNFADIIVPITNVNARFGHQDSTHLEGLLTQFVTLLRLNTCKQLMQLFVRRFIARVASFLKDDLKDVNQPLAKFLPVVADSFNVEAKNSPDSAFQDCLHSHELHQFTLMAFGADQDGQGQRLADEFGLD